jgi:hypothetical protein
MVLDLRAKALVVLLASAMAMPRVARADDAPETIHVTARFSTARTTQEIRKDACALSGSFQHAGRERIWDVDVDGVRCSNIPPDSESVQLVVRIMESGALEEGGARTVVLEAISDEIPQATLERAVSSTKAALRDAHRITTPASEEVSQQVVQAHHGHAQGTAIAVAATAGGIAVTVVVVIIVVVIVAVAAGIAAMFAALSKAL